MLNFNFLDEVINSPEDSENIQEEKKIDIEAVKKTVRIPKEFIPQLMKDYDCVVVRDFGDGYHMTDEERLSDNALYSVFKEFSLCKHTYRKAEQFVIAMRKMLKCLNAVAENNGEYDVEKFKKLYFNGKIKIAGLFMPKFKGKERKYISMSHLAEFIMSDEPASMVLPKEDIIVNEDEIPEAEFFFNDNELNMMSINDEIDRFDCGYISNSDDQSETRAASYLTDKEYKKTLKNFPEFARFIKDNKAKNRSLENMSRYAYDLTSDDLDRIDKYDKEHNIQSSAIVPEFTGDIMNDDDYNRYMYMLERWESENTYDNYHGKMKSLDEIRELELKTFLEESGWNIRALYGNKEKEKKLKRLQKLDEKRVKDLKRKLIEIDDRRKRRMGEDFDSVPREKVKKKAKKLKKKVGEFTKSTTNTNKSVLDWEDFDDES